MFGQRYEQIKEFRKGKKPEEIAKMVGKEFRKTA
jgi:hypothetical protein